MTTLADKPIFTAMSNADSEFDDLFLAQYDRVYGLLYRLVGTRGEAEDLAQEVFLKLYTDPPRRSNSNIEAWLYRVATNAGYNAIRKRNQRARKNLLLITDERSDDLPHQSLVAREEAAVTRAALGQLAPTQGQLLLLRQMGLSYKELAEICDLNPNSVGQQLARAAKAFKFAYLNLKETKDA